MTSSLQVTLDLRSAAETPHESVDIERLVATVPTAKALYGNRFGSMMVTVDEAHQDDLVRALVPYCTVEVFETLDPYGLDGR